MCVDLVESGKMTKDLAILIGAETPYLTTEQYLDAGGRRTEEADGVSEATNTRTVPVPRF